MTYHPTQMRIGLVVQTTDDQLQGSFSFWRERQKKKQVYRSSTEAEYRAMATTGAEVTWLRYLLNDLGIQLKNSSSARKGFEALACWSVFWFVSLMVYLDSLKFEVELAKCSTTLLIGGLGYLPFALPRYDFEGGRRRR